MPIPSGSEQDVDDIKKYLLDSLESIGSKWSEVLRDAVENAFDPSGNGIDSAVESVRALKNSYRGVLGLVEQISAVSARYQRGLLEERDVEKMRTKLEEKKLSLITLQNLASLQGATISDEELNKQRLAISIAEQTMSDLERDMDVRNEKLGITKNILETIKDIPFINKFIDTEEILQAVNKEASKTLSTQSSILRAGAQAAKDNVINLGKAAAKATILATVLDSIRDGLVDFDNQTVSIGKGFLATKWQAGLIREELVGQANASGDNFINSKKVFEANQSIGKQLGFNKIFSQDINTEFINLTKKMEISEESAGGLVKMSILNGKSLRDNNETMVGMISTMSSQYGIQLDVKEILDQTGKSASHLLTIFKGNPLELAKAIVQVKLLGTNLESTSRQAEALLNFESSIENTLMASLLTGRQFNLERARQFALENDFVNLSKELVEQGVSFYEYSHMNAIQQKGIASALGLGSAELSDQLLNLEIQGKSRQEILAIAGKEGLARAQQLTTQQKFNDAVEKLKNLLSEVVNGPIGMLLEGLVSALSIVGKITEGIQSLTGNLGNKVLGGALGGAAIGSVIPVIGTGVGALAGAGMGLASGLIMDNNEQDPRTNKPFNTSSREQPKPDSSPEVNDGIIDHKGKVLYSGNKGSIKFNEKDSIVAGTNLFDKSKSDNRDEEIAMLRSEFAELRKVIINLSNRPIYAKPSEFVVGNSQASMKSNHVSA